MRFTARVFLPLLLLGYIGTETYLKLQHTSLCGEVGCKLAGELLNFDAIYLNYVGMGGVFMLMILGFLSLKNKFYEVLFFSGLYGAIAFEATILSYQFVANPEPCIFCLGIISSLLLIALFSQPKHFAITLATVVAIFTGMHTLGVSKNKNFMIENGTYLIHSESCPHCKKVKAYLAEHHISYTPISTKEASARNFLKFAGITNIPVLVLKEKRERHLIVGDKKIITYYETLHSPTQKRQRAKETSLQSTPQTELSSDFLGAGGDEGCAITVEETSSCTKENETE
ncbi:Vitamin K epoxide reductase [hydrothermal vent metagenome]|uniref:Vitamin K epoxide reductase n=1 Tax=hydrothermal vent metagenome TaxID=652676 RepID=A0A1W1CJ61_9ZZZZ